MTTPTFAQHQVQAPELAQVVNQAAQSYSGEALNRLFAQQTQEAARNAQEIARQPTQAPSKQQRPTRERDGGLVIEKH